MLVAISGYGITGRATEETLRWHSVKELSFSLNDPAQGLRFDDWTNVSVHFICVPTPVGDTGYDLSAILDAIVVAQKNGFTGQTVLRSTIAPGDVSEIETVLSESLTQWPEFLREKHWKEDAKHPSLTMIGGPADALLCALMPGLQKTILKDARHAAMAKLSINAILAARTIVAHDLAKLCDHEQLDWTEITWAIIRDPRIGTSHWQQPGPDGAYGFGGSCFPKDMQALAHELAEAQIADDFASYSLSKNKGLR